MKRLIALLIAILTLLFGGVQPAYEPQDATESITAGFESQDDQDEDVFESCSETVAPGVESQDIETESVTELSTEKEKLDATAEAEADQPEDIAPSGPEATEDTTEPPIEATDEPITDTDTSSQLTEEEPVAGEQTDISTEPTVEKEPKVIPQTPIAEETTPMPTEKETEDSAEPNSNAPVFINPAQGDANPFENAPPTEIDDHPADEFIGEGGDRPGEGIHF